MPGPLLPVLPIIASVAIMQLASGLLTTFLPLRMVVEGLPATAVGIMVTGHGLGFLVGCLVAPKVIRAVGHIRVFAAFAATVAAIALAFGATIDTVLWTVLRFVVGFCYAGLFTVAESWLNDQLPSNVRGRVISLYMLANKLSFAGGQMLLTAGSIEGALFFMVGSAAFSLSLLPVALTRGGTPPVPEVVRLSARQLWRLSPVGLVGCFATGMVNAAAANVAPAYLFEVGQSTAAIASLMAVMQGGSLLLQWPLGWLSDRIDRRWVIAGTALGVAAVSVLLAATAAQAPLWALYGMFALWGGFALSVYGICMAHANDMVDRSQVVALSSNLLLAWAAGSVIGPILAAAAMDALGHAWLFLYCAAVSAGLAGFALWRMTRRAAAPVEERAGFVNIPATSPAVAELAEGAAEPAAGDAGRPA